MPDPPPPGQIVILNGAPRSGKIQHCRRRFKRPSTGPGSTWAWTPICTAQHASGATRPGIGLRPGGERPDLEPYVVASFAALYESIAAHSRQGLTRRRRVRPPRRLLRPARHLARLRPAPARPAGPAGRRALPHRGHPGAPSRRPAGEKADRTDSPNPARNAGNAKSTSPASMTWKLDTSVMRPAECAQAIRRRLDRGPAPTALRRLAAMATDPA